MLNGIKQNTNCIIPALFEDKALNSTSGFMVKKSLKSKDPLEILQNIFNRTHSLNKYMNVEWY